MKKNIQILALFFISALLFIQFDPSPCYARTSKYFGLNTIVMLHYSAGPPATINLLKIRKSDLSTIWEAKIWEESPGTTAMVGEFDLDSSGNVVVIFNEQVDVPPDIQQYVAHMQKYRGSDGYLLWSVSYENQFFWENYIDSYGRIFVYGSIEPWSMTGTFISRFKPSDGSLILTKPLP